MGNQIIITATDNIDLDRGYTFREGFIFAPLTHPANLYDAIVIRNPEKADCWSPNWGFSKRSLEEHIQYVNDNQIEKAIIIAEDIAFISQCPGLSYLQVIPADLASSGSDYSPLYQMREIKYLSCNTIYGERENLYSVIDYSKINGLIDLHISVSKGEVGYEKASTLKSLNVSHYNKKDLTDLFCSENLDSLRMVKCYNTSLDGLEKTSNMQCLYLHYNRLLNDISALRKVKKTLKALRIENCPKIEDFTVLGELDNLELLELSGSNVLPSLDFVKTMLNLKTFVFNMNVLDGDLSPCLNLSYVFSEKNRKHYNLKDKDLPKGIYVRGNEHIEQWRRWE